MNTVIKFAASSLVLGVTVVGCKPAADMNRPANLSSKALKADQQAAKFNEEAARKLQAGDSAGALTSMEQAVLYSPRDAGYRMSLAELYMKSGRFASAETTFTDVLALNPTNHRAAFMLTVALLGQGRTAAALANLESMDAGAAPADLGLAYAIAGNTQRALELLEPAARNLGATGRVRQNLALTYALAGDWQKARITAAQDVSPTDLDKRMAQWAALADPSAVGMRVANLMGVSPVADSGQPVRLALAPAIPAPAAFVETQAAPAEFAQAAAPMPVVASPPAAVAEVPVAVAVANIPAPVAASVSVPELVEAPTPVVEEHYAEAVKSLIETRSAYEASPTAILPTPIPAFIPAKPKRDSVFTRKASLGRYVVQIGAFSSARQVEKAWAQAQRRYGFAAAYEPLSTTVRINGKGLFHRLSVSGFDSPTAAAQLCRSIKAKKGACFVRGLAGDTRVQWASRYARKA